jgi:Fic family protein
MPNHELLLRPLQQREALRSSSLEGTYATPEELLLFQVDPQELASRDGELSAVIEVANYAKAMRRGQALLNELPISLRLIRVLHEELLSGVRGHKKAPGEFRRTQVQIGVNGRFIPPPANELTFVPR